MSKSQCPICEPVEPKSPWMRPTYSDLWPATNLDEWLEPNTAVCNRCIKTGKAILGDTSRQNAGGFQIGFEVYFDQKRRCDHCGVSYVFTASEQKFWYEELAFITHSEPTGCPACRRELRRRRVLNNNISRLLKNLDTTDWAALREVGNLCAQMGARKKALEYFRRAKNLCSDPATNEQILSEIQQAESALAPIKPRGQFCRLGWISSTTSPE